MYQTVGAPAKTALFAGASPTLRHPLRRGLAGEPWVPRGYPSAPRWAIAWASVYSVPVEAGWNAFM